MSVIIAELMDRACLREGCDRGMPCFGGKDPERGICIEAIAAYNALRKRELIKEAMKV